VTRFFKSRWDSIPDILTSDDVTVRLKRPDDCVVAMFTPDDWRKIFTDIDSDIQLNHYLKRESTLVKSFMLEDGVTGQPFGWICLIRHDPYLCDTVEFHGGSWSNAPGSAWKKFRAACLVIDSLLGRDIRVTSKAFNDNQPAIRFLQAIGFGVARRKSARPYRFLTLNRRRFHASPIYRRLLRSHSCGFGCHGLPRACP